MSSHSGRDGAEHSHEGSVLALHDRSSFSRGEQGASADLRAVFHGCPMIIVGTRFVAAWELVSGMHVIGF